MNLPCYPFLRVAAGAVLPTIPWITGQLLVAGVVVGTLAGGAAQAQQSTARPDFSGLWSRHYIPGFGPPRAPCSQTPDRPR
jgi:hypothetical protein